MGHYLDPITYRNLIKKIPIEMGISDFKQLTYVYRQFFMKEYQGSKSNSYCIESLFKYLYLIDVLEKFRSMFKYAKENGKVGKYQSVNEDMENLGKQVGIEKLMPMASAKSRYCYGRLLFARYL